jgi:hypothetical protein
VDNFFCDKVFHIPLLYEIFFVSLHDFLYPQDCQSVSVSAYAVSLQLRAPFTYVTICNKCKPILPKKVIRSFPHPSVDKKILLRTPKGGVSADVIPLYALWIYVYSYISISIRIMIVATNFTLIPTSYHLIPQSFILTSYA